MLAAQFKKNWFLILLLVIAIWYFYTAFTLPYSLIDDAINFNVARDTVSGFSQGNYAETLRAFPGISQKVYNCGFWLVLTFESWLSGYYPFHWLKFLELLFILWGIVCLHRACCQKSTSSEFAGFCAAFIFLASEIPGAIDMQSLRANWFRLFATDSLALIFLTINSLCIWKLIISEKPLNRIPNIFLISVAGISYMIACSIKLPMVVGLAPVVCLCFISFLKKKKLLTKQLLSVIILSVLLFACYFLSVRHLASSIVQSNNEVYGKQYSFDLVHLKEGWDFYYDAYKKIWGPFLIPIFIGALCFVVRLWKKEDYSSFSLLSALVYFSVWVIAFTVVYTPWNSRLGRYMLVGYFGFSMLCGLLLYALFASSIEDTKKQPLLFRFLFFFCGALALLMPIKVSAFAISTIVVLTCLLKRIEANDFLKGSISGYAIFFVILSILNRNAFNDFYVEIEHLNEKAMHEIVAQTVKGNRIEFAGDTVVENIGSIWLFNYKKGIELSINQNKEPFKSDGKSVLVANRWISPAGWESQIGTGHLYKEFVLRNPNIKVPYSFEVVRAGFFKNQKLELYQIWPYLYAWRFYN